MNLNEVYNGFKLIEETKMEDINSVGRIFEHEKSGARLFQIQNDDDNKVFQIGFRTPPYDNTGAAHIIEHSVFCGSRKFKTKEPFVNLAKGSLNTFLNAMTFPDKTLYPVASKNNKDFMNLMDVYLDAVFYPKIYETPEILMQEGWHYEINDKNDDIEYKGVVYNEMKGALSTPEMFLFMKIFNTLFKDTCYGFESGGNPDFIPELTYEKFLKFHKKYYHPSNSYIYLYGNGDINELLKFIDEGYLNAFKRVSIDSKIDMQKPFESIKEESFYYPISKDEKTEDKTYLSLSFVTGEALNDKLCLSLKILEHMLLETPAAPLKKALIDSGICKDVFGSFQDEIIQPVFSITAKNSNEDMRDKFKDIIYSTLKKLVDDGIDERLIEASINVNEFEMREANSGGLPRGLFYGITSMNSWLYNGNPMTYLIYGKVMEEIREAAKKGYFEALIKKYILENNHGALIILKPNKSLSEDKSNEIKQKLKTYKESLSLEELEKLVQNSLKLRESQERADSTEEMATIPSLEIHDIDKKADKLPIDKIGVNGKEILWHNWDTNGITYLDLFFDIRVGNKEDLKYVSLISDMIGMISTNKYSHDELSKEININIGGVESYINVFEDIKNPENIYPEFVVKIKTLTSKIKETLNILGEILSSTIFDDTKRIKEIIQEKKSQIEMSMLHEGNRVASRRLVSYFSQQGKYIEQVSGIDYYKFICSLDKNFNSECENIKNALKRVYSNIFNINNSIISITGLKEERDAFKQNGKLLMDRLSNSEVSIHEYNIEYNKDNEGLLAPGDVQYVAKGYNFKKLGYKYSGKLMVLRTILSLDYLWNNIRIKGGAYGGSARIQRNGNVIFASYRDPNLKESLNIYDNASKFIDSFKADEIEITRYIIGTISELDYPVHPSLIGEVVVANYLSNLTYEDIQSERDEVLSTKGEDIKNFKSLIEDVMKQDYHCVLGNEEKIKNSKDIFSNIITVFE